jgi:hypothetical protein
MIVRGDFPTLVWKSEEREQMGFIQLQLEEARHHAHILYVSPSVGTEALIVDAAGSSQILNGHVWLSLLDRAVVEVGQQGVHSLVAEVPEQGPELPLLRRAGFAVYARQDIWVLAGPPEIEQIGTPPTQLRLRQTEDDWDIQLLYANTVPRLVQLVEPVPPGAAGELWVVRDEQEELAAFVHIHQGPVGTWLRFFIHPNAEEDAEAILISALQIPDDRAARPIYCCVRRYEGWLPQALERSGFVMRESQAVMVKHTVKHTQQAATRLGVSLEGHGVPLSTPYMQPEPSQEVLERVYAQRRRRRSPVDEAPMTTVSVN